MKMKEQFRYKNFGSKRSILLQKIIEIVEEYQVQGIKLTLRQLYYQLVARGIIENKQKEYNKLGQLVTDARYCGYIDWNAIVDRGRIPEIHDEWDNVLDLVNDANVWYRLPRWENQEYYIELLTEKDALYSVLSPITMKWHIHLNVNRGYTSASAIYRFSKRLLRRLLYGKKVIILYVGDHDPSGLDMIRDIKERTEELLRYEYIIDIKPLAITWEQIRTYNPPPNPTKLTDPRAEWYISEHGDESWEVDALPPETMIDLVESSIEKYIDMKKWDKILEKEEVDREQLEEFAKELMNEDDNN